MGKSAQIGFVALSLGLAWAVRGHFGHEHGAAWAGAIGAMALVVASGRKDWRAHLPVIAAIAGIGWGAGGMMSYGIVVGYCRADDFANALYGFAMLSLIGGLYGFLGGGLLGLALDSAGNKRVDWPLLVAKMVAFGLLAWGILIYQLEWKMTPPRSELWAACLGAAALLAWEMTREGRRNALRLAWFASIGAGLGFALGNFLQILGNLSGIAFNWWNVMEFTLGFCGGAGMALGALGAEWPQLDERPSRSAWWFSTLVLLVAIPVTNLVQAFDVPDLVELGAQTGQANPEAFAIRYLLVVVAVAGAFAAAVVLAMRQRSLSTEAKTGPLLSWGLFTAFYVAMGHFKKGVFVVGIAGQLEQLLYWVLFALACLCAGFAVRSGAVHTEKTVFGARQIVTGVVLVVVASVAFAAIATSLHSGLPGSHTRF